MRKKSLNQRMVRKMDEEIRIIGYCTECGNAITDDIEEYFCNDDGELFCSENCVLESYSIHRLEI